MTRGTTRILGARNASARTRRKRLSFAAGVVASQFPTPAWRNWQTRWTQNPVIARSCGFEPLRRQTSLGIGCLRGRQSLGPKTERRSNPGLLSRRDIAFFTVLIDVEALPFDLRSDTQTDQAPYYCANNRASHHGNQNRDCDRLQLLQPQSMSNDSRETILRGGIERSGS